MRTRAVARSDGRMKVVSERLNWRARACSAASSRPRASSKTQSGLPVRAPPRVNTLTIRKAYWLMVPQSASTVRSSAQSRRASTSSERTTDRGLVARISSSTRSVDSSCLSACAS